MKQYLLIFTLLISFVESSFAQTDSPYKTSFKVDGPITAGAIALNGLGLYLISTKDGMTDAKVARLSKNDVNGFDRFSAGNYDLKAKDLSDLGFYGSFTTPIFLLLNKGVRNNAGQVAALYVETMAVTGTFFTMAAGNVYRARPLTYGGSEVPMKEKTSKNATNAFFAGHTAATASASFFVAKIFNDFNPDSPAKPFVWAAAAALPAGVGYLRLKAGKHFLSDNLLGYAIGSTAGILVPHLHKKSNQLGLSISPTFDTVLGNGVDLSLKF